MSISTNSQVIRLKNIGVSVKEKELLRDISIDFSPGKIYMVIGPSGTGKTTLLNLLAGLGTYSEGNITFGESLYQPANHIIGLVPQNYGLLPWQTAKQAVTSAMKITQKSNLSPEDGQTLQQIFQQLNLETVLDSYPNQLSGGQKQRVALARAFSVKAELLLMDEPFSALDALTRETTQRLFFETWQQQRLTTVFITHDIEEALLLAHEIIVLKGQPGTVTKSLVNPLADFETLAERRESDQFYYWVNQLRKEIQP